MQEIPFSKTLSESYKNVILKEGPGTASDSQSYKAKGDQIKDLKKKFHQHESQLKNLTGLMWVIFGAAVIFLISTGLSLMAMHHEFRDTQDSYRELNDTYYNRLIEINKEFQKLKDDSQKQEERYLKLLNEVNKNLKK